MFSLFTQLRSTGREVLAWFCLPSLRFTGKLMFEQQKSRKRLKKRHQMFDVMGLGGGNSFLAGLAILFGIPFPIWLWFRGEQMRTKSSLTR